MKRYNPKEIEPKWQQKWAESKIYEAEDGSDKSKKYILEYFPYPSGAAMHVGHVRNYTIGDAITRFNRMRGYNVLHPMGWDAFGLPAENYAIKTGISPKETIKNATAKFKKQLTQMGFGYDWSREFASSDPDYYKWTQWFFLLLHKRGLAYRKESMQWWCPVDKTVLANEQVENGQCWRCGSVVEKKALPQWFFKITEYADRLEKGLDDLNWTDAIKSMQRNWIGRSRGAEIDFRIDGSSEQIKVFTTRPDTIFGATFMVLAPEHPLVARITTAAQRSVVHNYTKQAQAKSDIERQETEREKTGMFTGAYAINPANNQKIPVWIADYVLYGYGTGAIMAVPAHDERDLAFAKKFDLPIRQVIMPCEADTYNPPKEGMEEVVRDTVVVHLQDKSTGKFALLDWHESLEGITTAIMGGIEEGQTPEEAALMEIKEEAALEGVRITKESRWITGSKYCASHKGENRKAIARVLLAEVDSLDSQGQIPAEEGKKHTLVWVDREQVIKRLTPDHQKLIWKMLWTEAALPGEGEMLNSGMYDGMSSSEVREKIVVDFEKQGVGKERVNYKVRDWLISRQRYWGAPIPMLHCEKCGIVPVPEDQLPVVLPDLESFEPSGDGRSPLARAADWVNTTCPKCDGPARRETDTMDGFACSSWYFLRFADSHNAGKPFDPQHITYWLPVDDYIGGAEHAVMHLLYARFWTKVMFDEGLIEFEEPFKTLRNQGMILAPDGQKMSKSKGNTIEPDHLIEQGYGADAIRIMELFIGPWNQQANWSVEGMGGSYRFLQRVWVLAQEYMNQGEAAPVDADDTSIKRAVHKAVYRVSKDLEELGFNTAVAALMETVNELYKLKTTIPFAAAPQTWKWALETLLQLLNPFAPHIAEELWQQLGHDESINVSQWPVYDEQYLVKDTMTIVVQVNGKVRAQLQVPADHDEGQVLQMARAHEKVAKYIQGEPRKSIYVPTKIVNFVV